MAYKKSENNFTPDADPRPTIARRQPSFPKPSAAFVPKILQNIPGFDANFALLLTQWPTIMGEPLCRFAKPDKIIYPKNSNSGATLQLQIIGAAALEIQHQQPRIIERINGFFGHSWIAQLRLMHGHFTPTLPSQPTAPAPAAAPVDLPELQQIDNPELRDCLQKLADAVYADKP